MKDFALKVEWSRTLDLLPPVNCQLTGGNQLATYKLDR